MSGHVVAALFTVGGRGGQEERKRKRRCLSASGFVSLEASNFPTFPPFFFSQLPIIFPFAIHFFDV